MSFNVYETDAQGRFFSIGPDGGFQNEENGRAYAQLRAQMPVASGKVLVVVEGELVAAFAGPDVAGDKEEPACERTGVVCPFARIDTAEWDDVPAEPDLAFWWEW